MERKKQEVIVIAFVAVMMTAFAAMPITAMSEYASSEHKAPLNVTTPTATDTATEKVITSMTIVQELETITFPAGTYVIPMDDKQKDIIRAFGFFC